MRVNNRNNGRPVSRTGRRGSSRNHRHRNRRTTAATFRNVRNQNRVRDSQNIATHRNRPTIRPIIRSSDWADEIQRRNAPRNVTRNHRIIRARNLRRPGFGTGRMDRRRVAESQIPPNRSFDSISSFLENHANNFSSVMRLLDFSFTSRRATLTKEEVNALPVMMFGEDGESVINVIELYEENNPVKEEEEWYSSDDDDLLSLDDHDGSDNDSDIPPPLGNRFDDSDSSNDGDSSGNSDNDSHHNSDSDSNNGFIDMPRFEMVGFRLENEDGNGNDRVNSDDFVQNQSDTNGNPTDDFVPRDILIAERRGQFLGQNSNESEDEEFVGPVPNSVPHNNPDANLDNPSLNEVDEKEDYDDDRSSRNVTSLINNNSDSDSDASDNTLFLTNANISGFDSDSSDPDSDPAPELYLREATSTLDRDSDANTDHEQSRLASSSRVDIIAVIEDIFAPKEVIEETRIQDEERKKLEEEAVKKKQKLIQAAVDASTSCSICICNFEKGEELRVLPDCGHAFHTDCIMPWLTQKKNKCPLCLTRVRKNGKICGERVACA